MFMRKGGERKGGGVIILYWVQSQKTATFRNKCQKVGE